VVLVVVLFVRHNVRTSPQQAPIAVRDPIRKRRWAGLMDRLVC
jgi:hypothetical protein